MTTSTQKEHSFTLILSGVSEINDDLENAILEAGCDDATLGSRDGVVFLEFDREAPDFRAAVMSAIGDVHKAGYEVARIEPDELVTAAEMARRLRRSRESVRQHILGMRGPGGFPPPISSLTGRSPLWRWSEVFGWYADHIQPAVRTDSPDAFEVYTTTAAINDVLDLLRRVPNEKQLYDLVQYVRELKNLAESPTAGEGETGHRRCAAQEARAPETCYARHRAHRPRKSSRN